MVKRRPVIADSTGLQAYSPRSVSLFSVLRRLFKLHHQLKIQERYCRHQLPTLVANVAGDDHTFSSKDTQRIIKYYQLSLNVLCGNLYQLTGNTLQANEHRRIVLLSVFLPFFDDLFDEQLLDHEQIADLVAAPEAYNPANKTDALVKAIYLELLALVPQRQLFMQQLQEVCHWENESLKQLNDRISEEQLYQITYNKSYYSILLFCAVLDHYPSPEIQKVLYPVAGLMQLTNDAFDVWKDVHNGVYTLPNLYRNYEQLQQQFLLEMAFINHQLQQLPYPVQARQTYAITVHALHAMGWMALEQLKKVTAGVSNITGLKALSRQELVCDLDSMKQQINWARHVHRFVNYYRFG
jgi:hypothetical protein